MNEDDLRRKLADVASHPPLPADPLQRVHQRIRRARRRRQAGLGGLAVAVVAALSIGGTVLSTPRSSPPASHVTTNKPEPVLHVALTAKPHGHKVRLRVHLRGYAYEPLDPTTGKPIHFANPAGLDALMGTQVHWGDGAQGGSDAGDVRCGRPHVVRHISDTYTLPHKYKKPGQYRIQYVVHGCGLPHKGVKRTTHITVKP